MELSGIPNSSDRFEMCTGAAREQLESTRNSTSIPINKNDISIRWMLFYLLLSYGCLHTFLCVNNIFGIVTIGVLYICWYVFNIFKVFLYIFLIKGWIEVSKLTSYWSTMRLHQHLELIFLNLTLSAHTDLWHQKKKKRKLKIEADKKAKQKSQQFISVILMCTNH